jgi:pyruvate/2-oxoglutarate dehydrogenase complex dihydrolipoamide acyltransferase (E2) component
VCYLQAGILAIGGTQHTVSLEKGEPVVEAGMTVTLSADNRVIDGDVAGEFLAAFAKALSNPVRLLSVWGERVLLSVRGILEVIEQMTLAGAILRL